MHTRLLLACLLTAGSTAGWSLLASAAAAETPDDAAIDYSREIRPLLSDNCFTCHGPDEQHREGGFRLDQKLSAFGEADSGEHPIVPGDTGSSELYARLVTEDESMRMPPEDSGKALTAEEIEKIRLWIEQGAPWQEHWAFITPVRPALPAVQDSSWPRNEIDRFILARLQQEGLSPAGEADKETLIRRVTFDLTGLPPTLDQVDRFLEDHSPEAYERLVDRLLQSPHYGEHMARFWLDAARYGDTHGLHLDNYREMWPYRDWVIQAFQDNMPYDRFTIEQLAGDLLPDAGLSQEIATGFNRCHVTTNEGGSIVEEVYVRNVVDRVVTTGTVFMGLTLDCTRCHDHKFDPLTMKDFYGLFAFFNSLDGNPMDGNRKDPAPVTRVLTQDQQQQLAALSEEIDSVRQQIRQQVAAFEYTEPEARPEREPAAPQEIVWIQDELPAGARPEGGWQFVDQPVYGGKRASTRTATGLSQHFFTGATPPLRVAEGDRLFCYVYLDPENPPQEIMLQWNDGSWEHRAYWGGNRIDWGKDGSPSRRFQGPLPETGRWVRLEVAAADVGLAPGAEIQGWAFTQFDGTVWWDQAGSVTVADQQPVYDSLAVWLEDQRAAEGSGLPDPLKVLLKDPHADLDDQQQRRLQDYFVEHVFSETRGQFDPLHQQLAAAEKKREAIEKNAATTLVFREAKQPKPAYLLNRGEYDQPRDEVPRATPAVLPPMPDGAPVDRLGLARWLVDPAHPLTARVAVNRFWQQVFGTGIVKTAEDFGSQGAVPSHPALLDWLAVDFRENGWDVRRLMRQLVLSATYRQSSRVTPELAERDPENRLLARGPRYRLDAEMLRDQALAVSGLLVRTQGGPSVKPPQPDGLWFAVGYSGSNTVRFKPDQEPDKVHRRTLYTFIKRTAPPPQMSTFDAPSREACSVRRERTNTPLQALLLLNDPQFFEAARALAKRTLREAGDTPEDRAATMYRLCSARHAAPADIADLVDLYRDRLQHFQQDAAAAEQVIGQGAEPPPDPCEPAELAAWTLVANLVLNLDQILTKN